MAKKKRQTEHEDDIIIEDTEDMVEIKGFQHKDKKLKEELESCKKERQEYLDGWQRSRADYANAEKRHEESVKRVRDMTLEHCLTEFLPVLDSFDMAIATDAWETVPKDWRTGMEHIRNQIIAILNHHNVESFGEVGDMVDPALHQAVDTKIVTEERLVGTLQVVMRKGYKHGENILRPAHVSIGVLDSQ